MKVTVLPKDLKINDSPNIQVYNYKTNNNLQRSKINLTKNTISFLRMGTKEVIGDDKTVLINNSKFIVMKSGNCLMAEKISNTDRVYQSILLFFSDKMVIDFLEKNKLFSKPDEKQNSFYIFKYDNFIQHYVESLEKISLLPKRMQEKILNAKFEEIMLYLTHQNGASFLNRIAHQVDSSVTRLTNIVEHNKYNKLSLQELAFLCNMSISTFKREFFKQYNKTPIKWFNDERLEHTAVLLRTNSKRPIDVYEDAGYENFSNFVQAFKKRFGVTPKQYQIQS